MPLGDFDIKVMLYIRDSGETVTMDLLTQKFGPHARSSIEALCAAHFLFWDSSPDDPFSHSDSKSKIMLTTAGERELNNYVESERLTSKERWKERVFGFVGGLFSGVGGALLTAWLLGLLHL